MDDELLIELLRDDLVAARYRVDVVEGLWGPSAAAALHRGRTQPATRALDAARASGVAQPPAAVLARLFLLGQPVAATEVAVALPRLGTNGAVELGLLGPATADTHATPPGPATADTHAATPGPAATDDTLRALVDLRPYSFVDSLGAGSWWIASDLGETALGRALDEDHVLGVGGASVTLSGLIIPTPADSVLDLGTGCGIQALHAARHARRVVATDISERALRFARFNAALNGIDGIEFRLGSLFEPVAGERFDRIVSNPPFVITPRRPGVPVYEYRDGGLVGDALVATVVRQAGEHLRPGGIAQLLGNWEYRADPAPGAPARVADGLERVRGWVAEAAAEGAELDAWAIERERQDAPSYAETWIRDGGTRPGTPAFDELYEAWLDDFDDRGVREVGFGYLLLRRPLDLPNGTAAAVTLARYERVAEAIGSNPVGLGSHLAACLDGHDWQAHRDDDALLRATLRYAGDITEERHYWPGQDDPVVMTLRQGGGFARSLPLGTALAAFVGACDGDLSVRAICGALAEVLGTDEGALTAELLPQVRELLADAFLLPE
jgi:methylase of polypeptide subunit release factors